MKLPIIIAVIFFIILGVIANVTVFKLKIMHFVGIMLIALIILGVIGTFVGKANRKRKGIQGEPNAFIFPDGTAKKLKKMDLGIQYEASVISSALLMLGIVLFLVYFIFFTESSWIMKGLIIFNSVCGLGLMGGMLVTYYQQLVSYRESTQFLRMAAQVESQPVRQRPRQPAQQPLYQEEPPYEDEQFDDMFYDDDDYNMKGGKI